MITFSLMFPLRSKFGIESLSILVWMLFKKDKVSSSQNMTDFLTIKALKTIMFIILWALLLVVQTFLSPQVKQIVIISNKLVYMNCHLSWCMVNDLILWILGNKEISGKSQNLMRFLSSAQFSYRNKFFSTLVTVRVFI